MFKYHHLVQFYETDMMGIVHHSNYLRIFEEARVAWCHAHGMLDYQQPSSAYQLAVYDTRVRHVKPGRFGDNVTVEVQARMKGIKIVFEYKMWRDKELLAECRTIHVPLDLNLKLMKPRPELRNLMEKQQWIETWLSNLSE